MADNKKAAPVPDFDSLPDQPKLKLKELFLVLISKRGGYELHSIHKDRQTAENWEKCKQHDGEYTSILRAGESEIETIREFFESN